MFSFLKSNPKKKLEAQHAKLLEEAVGAQRNGKIELLEAKEIKSKPN